jgi:hypothetical protein
MYDWHLLSSADMETWMDHGIIARPATVPAFSPTGQRAKRHCHH